MADAVDKLVDMEAEIDDLVDRLIDVKKEVITVIEQVDSPTEYNVLHMAYIQHMTLHEIANAYHANYGWAKVTLKRGRDAVQRIMEKNSRP